MNKKINNGIFYVVISLVACLAVGSVAAAYSMSQNVNVQGDYNYYEAEGQPAPSVMEQALGAFPGPDIYQDVNIHGALTAGGNYLASSTSGSAGTLAIKDLREPTFISFTSNVSSYTMTLPATSTMISLLPEIGSTRTWLIHNATTTAAITLTIAKGGGMDVVAVTANDDIIDGGEFTQLTCTQIPYLAANNENIMCIVDELANAD